MTISGRRQKAIVKNEFAAVIEGKVGDVVEDVQFLAVVTHIVASQECQQDDVGFVSPNFLAQHEQFLTGSVSGYAEIDGLDSEA